MYMISSLCTCVCVNVHVSVCEQAREREGEGRELARKRSFYLKLFFQQTSTALSIGETKSSSACDYLWGWPTGLLAFHFSKVVMVWPSVSARCHAKTPARNFSIISQNRAYSQIPETDQLPWRSKQGVSCSAVIFHAENPATSHCINFAQKMWNHPVT